MPFLLKRIGSASTTNQAGSVATDNGPHLIGLCFFRLQTREELFHISNYASSRSSSKDIKRIGSASTTNQAGSVTTDNDTHLIGLCFFRLQANEGLFHINNYASSLSSSKDKGKGWTTLCVPDLIEKERMYVIRGTEFALPCF